MKIQNSRTNNYAQNFNGTIFNFNKTVAPRTMRFELMKIAMANKATSRTCELGENSFWAIPDKVKQEVADIFTKSNIEVKTKEVPDEELFDMGTSISDIVKKHFAL